METTLLLLSAMLLAAFVFAGCNGVETFKKQSEDCITEIPDAEDDDKEDIDDENHGNGGAELTDGTFARDIEEIFPDPVFRAYVIENFDTDGDGYISEEEALNVTNIFVSGYNKPDDQKIKSLQGVEYFTALTYLDCGYNSLSELDVTHNTCLKTLRCSSNNLSKLDVANNIALIYLHCSSNNLSELDVTYNTALEILWCNSNNLSELDVSKTNLGNSTWFQPFVCINNPLEVLCLQTGWTIKCIYPERNNDFIPSATEILFKD